ncbi:MAG: hypothetical protein EXS32_07680 [Opitutus sp.]|nr:hypothetical protein [Opitutus sp.]
MNPLHFTRRPFSRFIWSAAPLVALGIAVSAPQRVAAAPEPSSISPAPVIDQPLPPSFAQEEIGQAPSAHHVWIAAHWRWQEGAYVWVAGRWEMPPVANVTWIEPRWEKKANGFVLVEGSWQDAPAPAPVVRAMPSAPPVTVVEVREAPPPPTREIIVERPSWGHVWISGHWRWHGGRFEWSAGHWDLPPRSNIVWVAPRWEQRGHGYVFVEGYWRDVVVVSAPPLPVRGMIVSRSGPRDVVVIHEGPPPPRREYFHERDRPSLRHVWVSGYWAWNAGRHVWYSGHWEIPPRGHTKWAEPRWEQRGGGYIFIEGSWR